MQFAFSADNSSAKLNRIYEVLRDLLYYRQMVIYGGMQRISSFTIRFLGWMIWQPPILVLYFSLNFSSESIV